MDDAFLFLLQKPFLVGIGLFLRCFPVIVLTPPVLAIAVPHKVRVVLAGSLAVLLLPPALADAEIPPATGAYVGEHFQALLGEALLGMLLGSVFLLAVGCMQVAGQLVGHLAGMDAARLEGADGQSTPIMEHFFRWIAIVILLTSGAHRQLMDCCMLSLESYPVGACQFDAGWFSQLQTAVSHSLRLGLGLAVPVGMTLLVSHLATGLLARTLPQFSALAVGFHLNLLAMLFALLITVGGIGWAYQHELSSWVDFSRSIVSGNG